MSRESLPPRRATENFTVIWGGISFNISIGFYEDGRVAEVFLDTDRKRGSQADDAARNVALLMSLALQYGCPLEIMKTAVHADTLVGKIIAAIEKNKASGSES